MLVDLQRKFGQLAVDSFFKVNLKTLHYSTVTDLLSSTPHSKYIPFLKFVCVIIYCKGSIVSTEYKDFDIVFIEKILI